MKLLDHYFEFPDLLELFDNTDSMILVGEFRRGNIVMLADPLPEWVVNHLGNHLNPQPGQGSSLKDLNDIDAVRKAYRSSKK